MQHGRVFYSSVYAAHLVTPQRGKGMNMALGTGWDELAAGLRDRYAGAGADRDRLARYSATRLPAVWQYEEFSNFMLSLLHSRRAGRANVYSTRLGSGAGLYI